MAHKMKIYRKLSYKSAIGGSLVGLIELQMAGMMASYFSIANGLALVMFSPIGLITSSFMASFIVYDTYYAIKKY